ncbi:MAG: hypothetical protein ACRBBP_08135 [Bdellovibrionales bacterium]
MYTKLLIFIIPALLTACGSSKNKVKDDWPGIDDSSFRLKNNVSSLSNKADTFSLTTEILLPKMGKDVSYTVTSTCTRKYPPSYQGEKSPYTKSTAYPASANENLKPLQIFEHLPEEMIIFPEHFSKCDFTLYAENQHTSDDYAALKDQKFQNLSDEHTISLTKRNFQDSKILPLRTELADFTLESVDEKKFVDLKTLCYSNKLTVTKTENSNYSRVRADRIILPKETKNFPLEYCRIQALSPKNGTILFSPIFKFINRDLNLSIKTYDSARISVKSSAASYSSSNFNNLRPLFTMDFTNTSTTDHLNVKIHAEDSVETIQIITSLKETSNVKIGDNRTKTYIPNFTPIDSYSAWTVPETGNTTSSMRLAPGKRKSLDFKTFPSYDCLNNNEELGFVIAPEKNNPLFTYSLMNHNEFVSEAFYTGSVLFDTDAQDGAGANIKINNLPVEIEEYVSSNSAFTLYFRNQNVLPGEQITLSHRTYEPQLSKNRMELTREQERRQLANRPFSFRSYVNQNDQTQCHSYDTIQTDGTSPDGDIILQPLGSRSVDL